MAGLIADVLGERRRGRSAAGGRGMSAVRAPDVRDRYDYLIVGAGFAGSVLAERLASQHGARVLLIDRRPHIGGNAYDDYDEAGILFHKLRAAHLPHQQRPGGRLPVAVHRVAAVRASRARSGGRGQLVPIPINLHDAQRLFDARPRDRGGGRLSRRRAPSRSTRSRPPRTSSSTPVGRDLYENFFRGYTRKQWGLDPSELDKR